MDPNETSAKSSSSLTVPISIVIAGGFIALAVYFSGGSSSPANTNVAGNNQPTETVGEMREVTSSDHIVGNLDADLIIVEYSDTECPFCKNFHQTMIRIMDEYGPSGQVAWVYRHFPIEQLHRKAVNEAQATECAAAQAGNEGFWRYINKIFEITPSNDGLDPQELVNIARDMNLDLDTFQTCLAEGQMAAKVQADYDDAISAGARGTPHSIVISKDGQMTPISGALPYETIKATIESLL